MKSNRIERKKGAALAVFFFALAIAFSALAGAEAYQSVMPEVSDGKSPLASTKEA